MHFQRNDLGNAKAFKIIAAASLCLSLMTACQTTQGFQKERKVHYTQTKIILPPELLKLKGFKVKLAKISETGSYRRDIISFTGGFFSYHLYFRGGFLEVNSNHLQKNLDKYYTDFKVIGAIKKANVAIGDVYYATVINDKVTCVVMSGNAGTGVQLRGGRGYTALTEGEYCENGNKPDLENTVVKWMRKFNLKS